MGWSGQVRKISSPPGFNHRTVQPIASRYTDYASQPTKYIGRKIIIVLTYDIMKISIFVLVGITFFSLSQNMAQSCMCVCVCVCVYMRFIVF